MSQKFRQVAESLKLNIDYIPVRLEREETTFRPYFYDFRGPGATW